MNYQGITTDSLRCVEGIINAIRTHGNEETQGKSKKRKNTGILFILFVILLANVIVLENSDPEEDIKQKMQLVLPEWNRAIEALLAMGIEDQKDQIKICTGVFAAVTHAHRINLH